jgi:hypothetical protein
MFVDIKNLAPLVKNQFPSFYVEEGDNFLQFVKAYYEWMDSEGGPEHKKRRLGEYRDIDQTLDEYIKYFMSKYMHGIPANILTNKKLLEKHILDIYRSKGSSEGMKLLFRLLYNKDIEIYTPQIDILKTSDGKWTERRYIEVTPINPETHFSYSNKFIIGATSGAIAFVDEAVELSIGRQLVYVLYITDLHLGINGEEFLVGEYLTYDGFTNIYDLSTVLGSASGASVISSGADNAINDILTPVSESGTGLKFVVKSLLDHEFYKGHIDFKLVDGGYGYMLDSPVSISYKTATTGSRASFKIGSITNPSTISNYNTTLLNPYLNTALNSANYGSTLNNANVATILSSALTFSSIQVGKIGSLKAVTSGDNLYDGSLQVNINDRRISGYDFRDANGKTWGNNAIITANLAAANGTASEVKLISSGYSFNTPDEEISTINQSIEVEVLLQLKISGVGREEGHWEDESGFLNADKYIQDSYYYQEYSYEIQVEKSLDKYVDVVKKVMHPVGNIMFGKPLIIDKNSLILSVQADNISTSLSTILPQNYSNTINDYVVNDNFGVDEIIWNPLTQHWIYTANGSIYV